MAVTDRHIENKQIALDDIKRLADTLEKYNKKWLDKESEENDRLGAIPEKNSEYSGYKSKIEYTISFKDGRTLEQTGYDWLVQNLIDLDEVSKVEMELSIYYTDDTIEDNNYHRHSMYYTINIKRDYETELLNDIKTSVNSGDLNNESEILHRQVENLKNEMDKKLSLSIEEILRFARILESYKMDIDTKAKIENDRVDAIPKKKANIDSLTAVVSYGIEWYDGRDKTEDSYDWFVENLKNGRSIKNISINQRVSYFDGDGVHHSLHSNIDFMLYKENYDSKTRYSVDGNNMDEEIDTLYRSIGNVFENCPVRYDKTIKNRMLRIQAFSIAIGAILSYIAYFVIRITPGNDFSDTVLRMLSTKEALLISQWGFAIIVGNIFVAWIINMMYKPLVPERVYDHYDSNNSRSVYKDDVANFVANSELQFGKFIDLKVRRANIEIIYKISKLILLAQAFITVLLYVILK